MVAGEEREIHVVTLEIDGQSEPRNVCSDWSLTKAPSQSHEVSHQAMAKRPWLCQVTGRSLGNMIFLIVARFIKKKVQKYFRLFLPHSLK